MALLLLEGETIFSYDNHAYDGNSMAVQWLGL